MASRAHRRWIGIARALFGVGLLGVLFYFVDPTSVVSLLEQIQPGWILLAMGAILLATMLGAINLFLLFQDRNLLFRSFLPLYWTSWAIGLVVPGQVGDVASIAALLHRRGQPWQVVLGRSLLDKLVSFAVLVGFAVVGIAGLVPLDALAAYLVALLSLGAGAIILILRSRRIAQRWGGLFGRLHGWIDALSQQVWACFSQTPFRVTLNVLLTIVKTALIGVAYWAVFHALGYAEVGLQEVVPLVAASSLVAYLPVSFNGIGTVEAVALALFGSLAMTNSAILTAYLLLRVTTMGLAWLPAGLWLMLPGKKAADRSLG